jgi:hypothetical protein
MRYPEGGGLSAAGRVRREEVQLQAAEWFAEGVKPPEVARRLPGLAEFGVCRGGAGALVAMSRWPRKARVGRCAG